MVAKQRCARLLLAIAVLLAYCPAPGCSTGFDTKRAQVERHTVR
jgi:hypothetical protein